MVFVRPSQPPHHNWSRNPQGMLPFVTGSASFVTGCAFFVLQEVFPFSLEVFDSGFCCASASNFSHCLRHRKQDIDYAPIEVVMPILGPLAAFSTVSERSVSCRSWVRSLGRQNHIPTGRGTRRLHPFTVAFDLLVQSTPFQGSESQQY